MRTSDAGLGMITRLEGEVLRVYKDPVGIPTIGVGHVVRPGESFPNGITKEESRELLRKDVAIAEDAVNDAVKVPLSQDQFDALVSFTFNVGTGALRKSTLLRLLNQGDYQGAADQFPKWRMAGGKVLQGLVNRRKAERQTFMRTPAPSLAPVACSGSVDRG